LDEREREREKKEGEHEGAEQGRGAWLLKKRKSEEKGEERGKKNVVRLRACFLPSRSGEINFKPLFPFPPYLPSFPRTRG